MFIVTSVIRVAPVIIDEVHSSIAHKINLIQWDPVL